MPNLRTVNLLWCLYVFAAAAPPVPRAAPDMAFDADDNGAVVVPIRIDGEGPFRFIIDTGSSHSAIADRVEERLGLIAVAKAEIMSAAGQSIYPVVRVGRIAAGSSTRDGLLASVLPSADLQRLGRSIDGVLGQDFLSAFDYTIDYRRNRLTWDAGDTSEVPAARLALAPESGRFIATLPQGAGRAPVRIVPDTGSASLVIFRGASPSHGTLALRPLDGQARMRGVAGERTVDRVVVPVLRIGDLVWRDEPAVVVDRVASSEDTDGLLPLHRFARVSFNARDRCLLIWAR
jgi:predicted aspartyl protease